MPPQVARGSSADFFPGDSARPQDVNLKAAQTFSCNDFISNGGILVAGGLVLLLGQRWPDLVVGGAVALVALWGGVEIRKDARRAAGGAEHRV